MCSIHDNTTAHTRDTQLMKSRWLLPKSAKAHTASDVISAKIRNRIDKTTTNGDGDDGGGILRGIGGSAAVARRVGLSSRGPLSRGAASTDKLGISLACFSGRERGGVSQKTLARFSRFQ